MNKKVRQELKKIIKKLGLPEDTRAFDRTNWNTVSLYKYLSEDFIREFLDEMNWHSVSRIQKLSEKFIIEFQNCVNWGNISCCQVLSEKFIRNFKKRVIWDEISLYQKFSRNFIREFQDQLDLNVLHKRNLIRIEPIICKKETRKIDRCDLLTFE